MPLVFLAPLALAALGLAAAPVVIHMLRRSKSRRLDFPSLRFLRETPSLVRRLTPPNRRWLMAARIAVICLIALAAARPVWTGGSARAGSATVVVIDASASMSRIEAREAAIAAAREAIGRLGDGDIVSVAQFDSHVRWLARRTGRAEALASLASYTPGLATAKPAVALSAAEQALADAPPSGRRVVLISDFQRSNGPWQVNGDGRTAALEAVRIENEFENAFIADAHVEAGKDGERLVTSMVRAGPEAREVTRAEAPLVEGAASDGFVVSREAELWTARVTIPDGFDADDARFGVFRSPGAVVVCDPGPGVSYLAAAARVNEGDARVSVVPRIDAAALSGASLAIISSRALSIEGAPAALEDWLRGGGAALVFAATQGSAIASVPAAGELDDSPSAVSLAGDPGSRAVAALRAGGLRVRPVDAEGGVVLARDGLGRPVVVRKSLGSGSVTVAGFDASPDAGRLVFDGGFPDVVRELAGGHGDDSFEAGDTLAGLAAGAEVVAGSRRLELRPDGTALLDSTGRVSVKAPDGVRQIAVNVPRSESEPGQLTDSETAALSSQGSADSPAAAGFEQPGTTWPLWRVLLAIALVAAIAELAFAGARRRARAEGSSAADGVALGS